MRIASDPSLIDPPVAESYSRGVPMTITISSLQPIIALAAGVLILIMPRLLNFIVAIYLILVGLIGLGVFRALS